MNNERLCVVCGKPVSRKDSGGLVKVYLDGAGGERREYYTVFVSEVRLYARFTARRYRLSG